MGSCEVTFALEAWATMAPGPGSYKHHPNSLAKAIRNKLEAQLSSQWEGPTNIGGLVYNIKAAKPPSACWMLT